MAKRLAILEAPSNLGLIAPSPGSEPGVKWLAPILMDYGFGEGLTITDHKKLPAPPYQTDIDPESKVRNADAIVDYSKLLAEQMIAWRQEDYFSITLGGDCSILIGHMLALKQLGRYGLFFLDGHTDFVLPSQSRTAGAAGMDLAMVTGHGPGTLCNIEGLQPYVKEEDVFCFGNRVYIDWYEQAIRDTAIHYFNLVDIRRVGIPKIAQEFLDMVSSKQLDGFWIHFDVDVLNDEIMPCVDSRSVDGLRYEELKEVLVPLLSSPLAAGMDITILDPTLDKEGKYSKEFVRMMNGVMASRK
jgi:arginase